MKTHVLTVSRVFPVTHPKKGLATGFPENILNKTKIHTIRGNYPFWEKRINEINEGKAVLSVRVWTGKPYQSPQKEIARFDKNSGIGIGMIRESSNIICAEIGIKTIDWVEIAKNDGLSFDDFCQWFDGAKGEMAIIHFTSFRY